MWWLIKILVLIISLNLVNKEARWHNTLNNACYLHFSVASSTFRMYKFVLIFLKKKKWLGQEKTHYFSNIHMSTGTNSRVVVLLYIDLIAVSSSVSLLPCWEVNVWGFCLHVQSQKLITTAILKYRAGNETVKLWFLQLSVGRDMYWEFLMDWSTQSQQRVRTWRYSVCVCVCARALMCLGVSVCVYALTCLCACTAVCICVLPYVCVCDLRKNKSENKSLKQIFPWLCMSKYLHCTDILWEF